MWEIFYHPWLNKLNKMDFIRKINPPPIIPDILSFNFDEVYIIINFFRRILKMERLNL